MSTPHRKKTNLGLSEPKNDICCKREKSKDGDFWRGVKILGIDYGKSNIGLAIADEETRMAFGYSKIKNDKNLIQKISEIIAKENISQVIIGIPSYANRKETEYDGEKFGKLLQQAHPEIEIEYQDEMFTTKIAQDNLIEGGKKRIKDLDDEESARIILQEWLDRTHNA